MDNPRGQNDPHFDIIRLAREYLDATKKHHSNAISAVLGNFKSTRLSYYSNASFSLEMTDNYVDLKRKGLATEMHINHHTLPEGRGHRLDFANNGPGLTRDFLNTYMFGFGGTTKASDNNQIGKYGQGVNVAISHFGSECVIFSRPVENTWVVALFSR
jgi:hypothetical protein